MSDDATLQDRLAEAIRAGRPAGTATVITGATIGRRLLVLLPTPGHGDEHLETIGTLGGAALDRAAVEGVSRQVAAERSHREALAGADGDVDVFFEVFPQPPALLIFGAVHVAQALCTLGRQLGYRVVVSDARGALATEERFPDANQIIVAWPDVALERLVVTETTDVAILTHDPKFDEPAIRGVLATPARYIGAIGSRSTNEERRQRLRAAGVSDDDIDRIHGPIGLNIGAETPEEMAVAIMAEIIASRHDRPGGGLVSAAGRIRNA